MQMQNEETPKGKGKVQSVRVNCGKYTVTLEFCENRDTDIMIPIKELIMSAYDLSKQKG